MKLQNDTKQEYTGFQAASQYAGLCHFLFLEVEEIKTLLRVNFETAVYLLVKLEVMNFPDLRLRCSQVLDSWVGTTEPENTKNEPKDAFLKWISDSLKT